MTGRILIKSGHVVDPSQGIDKVIDILIEGKRIKLLREDIVPDPDTEIINAEGLYVVPGLIDMHVHLREPGYEYKEDIGSGTLAALRGGFTAIASMPNTDPVNDNPQVTNHIIRRAFEEDKCIVYPLGSITKGLKGEELSEMGMMHDAGCRGFSDDGRPVMNSLLMRRALEYSRVFNVPVISHCEDLNLTEGCHINEGRMSSLLGLRGIPSQAEEIMVMRDIMLAELTGGRLHIAHVSTGGSVELIRSAKKKGIDVTAETCPHYFTLTEDYVEDYNTMAKVNPPLRTKNDVEAIIEGLKDGTIDVIATDHAPHHMDEKLQEFDKSLSGISGLETSLSLSLRLVHEGFLTLSKLVEKMSLNPARILGVRGGTLIPGEMANITIFDLQKEYRVDSKKFISKGKNTPFDGWILKGMVVMTISKGRLWRWVV